MSRNFTDPMQWDNTGVEPSSSLKQNGFTGGQKPPATVFNYLFNKIKTWVTELQGAVDDNDAKEVGKKLEGQTVSPTASSSVTAGDGAEIFNDYRERTIDGFTRSGNVASGDYSHAEGEGTTASGKRAHSEGAQTYANGNNSHAEGGATYAGGVNSHAEGMGTQANGTSAHAEGNGTHATGDYSHAENDKTTAFGNCSHAEGVSSNSASSDYTQDTANSTITTDWANEKFSLAKGKASHVEGKDCLALSDNSHAEGNQTTASGADSHAEGYGTQATGDYSHAEGSSTLASGAYSHAAGFATEARRYQTVSGKLNTPYGGSTSEDDQSSTATIFIVGNGTSTATSNALRITSDGQCRGLKAFIGSGADFAEYFEWKDGNPNNEDRRGKFVTLDGEKIKLANDWDYILGVISGSGAFIGNVQSENWQGKYLKDVYGDWLTQQVEVPESTDEKTGELIPAHTITRYVVNPDFDQTEEYISREFRKEWSPVGMLGQITLVDDGTCVVNGYCKPSTNGVGTSADSGYRVLRRIDNTHVKVLVK